MRAVGKIVGKTVVRGQDTKDGGAWSLYKERGGNKARGGRMGGRGRADGDDACLVLVIAHV